MLQHASGVTCFPARALKSTLVYSYWHWYRICVHIQRCSHVMYIFMSLNMYVCSVRTCLCSRWGRVFKYIYIHMLPHDQKRNMNMVDFFFWGGYQVTIQIYPCTYAICFVSCDYIWIYNATLVFMHAQCVSLGTCMFSMYLTWNFQGATWGVGAMAGRWSDSHA